MLSNPILLNVPIIILSFSISRLFWFLFYDFIHFGSFFHEQIFFKSLGNFFHLNLRLKTFLDTLRWIGSLDLISNFRFFFFFLIWILRIRCICSHVLFSTFIFLAKTMRIIVGLTSSHFRVHLVAVFFYFIILVLFIGLFLRSLFFCI